MAAKRIVAYSGVPQCNFDSFLFQSHFLSLDVIMLLICVNFRSASYFGPEFVFKLHQVECFLCCFRKFIELGYFSSNFLGRFLNLACASSNCLQTCYQAIFTSDQGYFHFVIAIS